MIGIRLPLSPTGPRILRPRRLTVAHDYPRATGGLGRPHLEAARVVPLPASFPRHRTVSDGRSHEDPAWWGRTAAHRARWAAERNRDRSIFGRSWS